MAENVTEEKKKPIENAWDLVETDVDQIKGVTVNYPARLGMFAGSTVTSVVSFILYEAVSNHFMSGKQALFLGAVGTVLLLGKALSAAGPHKKAERSLERKLKQIKVSPINGTYTP